MYRSPKLWANPIPFVLFPARVLVQKYQIRPDPVHEFCPQTSNWLCRIRPFEHEPWWKDLSGLRTKVGARAVPHPNLTDPYSPNLTRLNPNLTRPNSNPTRPDPIQTRPDLTQFKPNSYRPEPNRTQPHPNPCSILDRTQHHSRPVLAIVLNGS